MDIQLHLRVVLFVDTEAYFGNETRLLVFLKSCTVTLKRGDPANLMFFSFGTPVKLAQWLVKYFHQSNQA